MVVVDDDAVVAVQTGSHYVDWPDCSLLFRSGWPGTHGDPTAFFSASSDSATEKRNYVKM